MTEEDHQLKKVVGLKYDREQSGVPRVILKAAGQQAEQVLKKGRRISPHKEIKDEQLLKQLYRLPVDAEIGPELFELVAMLLVHVYSIDDKYGEKINE